MSQLLPEQTIQYKTYAKQTLVEGLTKVFKNHPDDLLQATKVAIEFPKTEADYPSLVVRMYERSVYNAGVGHQETVHFQGQSPSIEIAADLPSGGAIQISWPAVPNAVGYRVYRGLATGEENQYFQVTGLFFRDTGEVGTAGTPPVTATAELPAPNPVTVTDPGGSLVPGTYYYQVVALAPSQAIVFKHYFYDADIEFAVYALSAYDRDLVADTLVQTIAMGTLNEYTNSFFDRVYANDKIYPYSDFHFINVNSDQIQGFGETQTKLPWSAEDDLMYSTSYRVGVFGELYSLPPNLSYAIVQQVLLYPYIEGYESPPLGQPNASGVWISNDPF